MNFFKEWLGDLGIDAEVSAMRGNKLTNVILDGDFDAFEWGWYVEPDPDSMLSYFTCDQRGGLVRLVVLQRRVRRPVRAAARRDGRRRSASDDRQADAADALRGLAVPRHGVHRRSARRSAATGSPASSRSPTRAASCCSSTASHNYLNIRPAADAGDCDGVATALGAEGVVAGSSSAAPTTRAAARRDRSASASWWSRWVGGGSPGAPAPWTTAARSGVSR